MAPRNISIYGSTASISYRGFSMASCRITFRMRRTKAKAARMKGRVSVQMSLCRVSNNECMPGVVRLSSRKAKGHENDGRVG